MRKSLAVAFFNWSEQDEVDEDRSRVVLAVDVGPIECVDEPGAPRADEDPWEDAVHEEAFEDDQLNVTKDETGTEVGEAENEITGAGVTGSGVDPPPPPPPQELNINNEMIKYE